MARKTKAAMNRGEALFLVIVGLFLGTVFTGMLWWQSGVTREEALPVQATLETVTPRWSKRGTKLQGISLDFADHGRLTVDSANATEDLLAELRKLPANSACTMLVHPNSDKTILSLEADGRTLLDFDRTAAQLAGEGYGFAGLGLALYGAAAWGARTLWRGRKRT